VADISWRLLSEDETTFLDTLLQKVYIGAEPSAVSTSDTKGSPMSKRIVAVVFAGMMLSASLSFSQQIEATVNVNYESVSAANKDLLQNFKSDIEDYLNNFKWNDQGGMNEKIKCNFDIFVQTANGDNYTAQVFVGSKRTIYNSTKATAVLRILDDSWEFKYIRYTPINHNAYSFNDLASFLDFYVYIIIGYDYDTYDRLGGSVYLQRAADIASLGRSSGQKGWAPGKSGFSRAQFSDELNNNKFAPVRVASYIYHFEGLDSLAIDPMRCQSNMLRALDIIAKVKSSVDPRNLVIKLFFETKYLEIADTFLTYPDPNVYYKFGSIDQSHQTTYEQYRMKREGG
jgi:Domain of unknown function (DUF4835)